MKIVLRHGEEEEEDGIHGESFLILCFPVLSLKES